MVHVDLVHTISDSRSKVSSKGSLMLCKFYESPVLRKTCVMAPKGPSAVQTRGTDSIGCFTFGSSPLLIE